MKNNKLCKFSALVLAAAMVLAMIPVSALAGFTDWFSTWADAEEVSVETQATSGTTSGQPFASGTGGSTYFRIPAIVTLDDGTIVAAADARWNTTTDGGGLDTIVSYSKDNGETWNYSFANYLDDNGNVHNKASTTFIDPALATDGDTVYMLVDLFPSGYSNTKTATTYVTKTGSGFNSNGTLKLCAADSSSYDYYLGEFDSVGYAYIYDSNDAAINDYKVDQWFNLYKNDVKDGNLFYTSSAYHVYTTQYLYLTKSTDGGETWSAPTLINLKEDKECFYGVCPGSGCVTADGTIDGTILFTCYGCEAIGANLRASYIYSEDGGETWNRSWDRDTLTFQNCSSEASITEVTVGSSTYLYMFTRYYGSPETKGAYYFSDDGGKTWTAKTGINYTCSSDMGVITYSKLINDKPAMLLSAHSSSGRNSGLIYALTVEEDGALTLLNTYDVPGTSSYYAYSDLTELSDGSIGLLYESNTAEITFKKIDIRDIVGEDATITEPDTGTTEPEEPENATVTDTVYGISVSAPGLTKVEVSPKELDASIYQDKGVAEIKAYEIKPYQGETAYTGEATVTFNRPDAWTDENRIKGFIQESDGTYNWNLTATVTDDTVTVTFPHFSVGGICYAAETTSEDGSNDAGVTKTVDVELTVGDDSEEYTIEDAYYTTATATTEGIVTWALGGAEEVPATVKYVEASGVKCGSLISSDAEKQQTQYYYTPDDGTTYYPLYVTKTTSRYVVYYYYYYYYDGTDYVQIGNYQEVYSWNANSTGVAPTIYTKTGTEGTPASTTITFHAVSAGTTSVIVGNTKYNITVKKATQNIPLTIGGTYTLENAGKTVSNTNSTVATATIANGNLTIKGVAVGSTIVETEKHIVNVTVTDAPADGTHKLVSAEDVKATFKDVTGSIIVDGDYVTALVLSYSTGKYGTTSLKVRTADSETATIASWSSSNEGIAKVDKDGNITATGVGNCTVTATFSDGSTTTIPVRVVDGYSGTTESEAKEQVIYVDELYHSKLFVIIASGNTKDLTWQNIPVGCVCRVNLEETSAIVFGAEHDDGYAITYIGQCTNVDTNNLSAGSYHFVGRNGDSYATDSSVEKASDAVYFYDYARLNKNAFIGTSNISAPYTKEDLDTVLKAAVKQNIDACFYYSVAVPVRFQVISDKLPTLEKKIVSVEHNGETKGYTDGMKIELGDTINYQIEVTTYKPHSTTYTSSSQALFGTIKYSDATWTDELTGGSGSIDLTASTASAGTIVENPDAVANETRVTATTSFKLSMDNFDKVVDGTLTNTATLNYTYDAEYSKGTATASADAKAACKITTPTYIVDFGLPVELDLSSDLGGATIDGINSANLADFKYSGSTLTYTASKPLSAEEYVGLTLKKSTDGATVNQHYGVTIIPASNVLYEEDFLTPPAEDSSKPNWTHDGTTPTATQTAETVNAANPTAYGYDPAYASSTKDNGVYKADNLDSSTMTAALTTTFTGTGFDLIGNCGADTGSVMLFLKEKTTNARKVAIIDTRYTGGTLNQVPLAHLMVDEGTYEVKIFASGLDGTTTNANSAVSTYSMNHTSIASTTAFERYLKENNITDVEYIVMNDVLTASTQSVSAVSNYAVTADTPALQEGKHVEIDAFRVYYPTNNESYNAAEKNVQYMNILDVADSEQVNWWLENGTYTGEIAGYEAAGGPQNEIYLTGTSDSAQSGQAVTFQITGADSIQVSLRSVDGKQVIAGGHTIESSSEMYYTIQRTDNDGTFTIVNTGTGILGIGNVKIPGGTNEASILTASELDPEVVSYSIRMALAVEPDQTVEDESEQPVTFVPEKINVSSRSVNVLGRKLVTVSVTASTDVAYIAVNGQKVNAWNNGLSWIYQPSTLRFTFTDLLKRGESKTYEIVAYNADGVASAVYTVQG